MPAGWAALALVVGCGTSVPAHASIADCLWNHLSVVARSALYSAYEQSGSDGLEQVTISDTEIEQVHRACVSRDVRPSLAHLRATGVVLVGEALRRSALPHLTTAAHVEYKHPC